MVAEIPFDAAATTGQMVVGARQAIEEARHREMEALASRIKEGLGHGGHGVAGFDDVMAAVGLFKVQTLLVDRNFRDPGWRCPELQLGESHRDRDLPGVRRKPGAGVRRGG